MDAQTNRDKAFQEIKENREARVLTLDEKMETITQRLQNLPAGYSRADKEQVYNYAVAYHRDTIVGMLLANYAKSGIETKSGTLLANIKNANIHVKMSGSTPVLHIQLPTTQKLKKYAGKSAEQTYAVANALDTGAVRGGKPLSKYARNKVKKMAKEGKAGGSSVAGYSLATTSTGLKASTVSGKSLSLSITPAFEYFNLTPSQFRQVEKAVMEVAYEFIV